MYDASKTEALLAKAPYDGSGEEIFLDALLEELAFHYDNIEAYKNFCQKKGFDPYHFSGTLEDIPYLQTAVFKELGGSLSSVPAEDISLTLQSSATSGQPSQVAVDKITSKRQAKAMVKVVGDVLGNDRRPFLVMDMDPRLGFGKYLGARYAAVSGYLRFATEACFFLKIREDGEFYFDQDAISAFVRNLSPHEPAVVFGFTYILYAQVLRLPEAAAAQAPLWPLPPGSKVIHIGGWKKLEGEKVSKKTFNQLCARVFGIQEQDVVDIYGFTEQMGLNYPDCPCGYKHLPAYAKLIVRHPATKEPLPDGEEGMLEFLTPLPHSYPGNAVLTDDLGCKAPPEIPACPHRAGDRFLVKGRLKKAETRGCGDILSQKLFGPKSSAPVGLDEGLRLWYAGRPYEGEKELGEVPRLEALGRILREKGSWLLEQPMDALIGLISHVAKKWENPPAGSRLDGLQQKGLGFLASWCKGEHLQACMTQGLLGNRLHTDGFIPCQEGTVQSQMALPRGLVCHWLAGNVQVLGMFVLIQSILTKNFNILKISSRDDGIFSALLDSFSGESYTTPGGYTIEGDALLETVGLVYFGHGRRDLAAALSAMADVRIAWGGREAVEAVCSYPAAYDCQTVVMGPKLSFSLISREALQDERKAAKLARRLAVDASVFDQEGCASPHNVFIEEGGAISPEKFFQLLAQGMDKTALQLPPGEMPPEMAAQVHNARGLYDFTGQVLGGEDLSWTLLWDRALRLSPPVYGRVLHIHPIGDMMEAIPLVHRDIQSIGLAASGHRAEAFAKAAAARGAVRFPAIGRMLNFDSPWDGMYVTERLVRWVRLGGPLV